MPPQNSPHRQRQSRAEAAQQQRSKHCRHPRRRRRGRPRPRTVITARANAPRLGSARLAIRTNASTAEDSKVNRHLICQRAGALAVGVASFGRAYLTSFKYSV